MRLNNVLKISALASLALVGCDDMFEPNIENIRNIEVMSQEPVNFYGLLMNAYSKFNDGNTFYSDRVHEDFSTSDFYSNDESSYWLLMGRGSWRANNNPVDKWGDVRTSIQYINLFLRDIDNVTWSKDEARNEEFKKRLSGEAYALRGIHNYFFLRAHAGYVEGKLMGVPILTEPEDVNSDFNVSREDFQTCIDQIMSDFNKAIELLPAEYKGTDIVYGETRNGLLNGTIVKALKSEVALMAASPLYSGANNITWQDAANLAADVLAGHSIVPNGNTWYTNYDEIDALKQGQLPAEVLWRGDVQTNKSFETASYPPTLYGNGDYNPTQNLVDAFPMANGYPITDANSNYDPANPYANRDPRLDLYIIHDGTEFRGTVINTCSNSETTDGLNREQLKSTKTGYYLKKFLNEDCNVDPSAKGELKHYKARIRYTELFLNYAEAQNEAAGPTSGGNLGMSPYEIVKAIRERGGIKNDQYLESIKGDKDKMRELIHNERRIELMGENFRFWDLRRWNDEINESVYGMNITASGTKRTYNKFKIDDLRFQSYMKFGPIPELEVLKWSNLKQNEGWN